MDETHKDFSDPKSQPAGSLQNDLAPSLYAELRAVAAWSLQGERASHTLQPTALVHEAFLRLQKQRNLDGADRRTYCAAAARQMKQLLIDYGRQRHAQRRDARRRQDASSDGNPFDAVASREIDVDELFDITDAIERLAALNARQADVVTLRYYGGLSHDEIASELGVSVRTVENEWRFARAWLQARLRGAEPV